MAETISQDLESRPLATNEKLILIGSSGGGTVAVESLDLLQTKGIYVDQVILRGSPVQELILQNVGEVDYITSNFDYYYSVDVNPFDDVTVQKYKMNFWGHVPPNANTSKQIAVLIVNLVAH